MHLFPWSPIRLAEAKLIRLIVALAQYLLGNPQKNNPPRPHRSHAPAWERTVGTIQRPMPFVHTGCWSVGTRNGGVWYLFGVALKVARGLLMILRLSALSPHSFKQDPTKPSPLGGRVPLLARRFPVPSESRTLPLSSSDRIGDFRVRRFVAYRDCPWGSGRVARLFFCDRFFKGNVQDHREARRQRTGTGNEPLRPALRSGGSQTGKEKRIQ
jgi:hypothetical protein